MFKINDIIEWLVITRSSFQTAIEHWDADRQVKYENLIGKVALVAIQELIKIQHISHGGDKHDGIMRMDGNADNYHELDTYVPPVMGTSHDTEFDKCLIKTASKLLKYGS